MDGGGVRLGRKKGHKLVLWAGEVGGGEGEMVRGLTLASLSFLLTQSTYSRVQFAMRVSLTLLALCLLYSIVL
jgi:hypothetical protein